jgi:hypothetical protein
LTSGVWILKKFQKACFHFVIMGYGVYTGEKNIYLFHFEMRLLTKCGISQGVWILLKALYNLTREVVEKPSQIYKGFCSIFRYNIMIMNPFPCVAYCNSVNPNLEKKVHRITIAYIWKGHNIRCELTEFIDIMITNEWMVSRWLKAK